MKLSKLNRPSLVTGGCGFVGRHVVNRLIGMGRDVVIVDDLSTGIQPAQWLGDDFRDERIDPLTLEYTNGRGCRVVFHHSDLIGFLRNTPEVLRDYFLNSQVFEYCVHLAAVVGGRLKIDGDPMSVARDLALDAEFFGWLVKAKPMKNLYASSSAAYPIELQKGEGAQLREEDIDFEARLGRPDMTYGWSKLTGEYLAQIAAKYYDVSIVCIRPFSGYGEDQDLSYPVPAIARRAALKEDPFEVWGTGEQGRDFVHIEDCVDLMFLALDKCKDGRAYNIGCGKLTSFIELIQLFTRFAGYQPTIKRLLDKPVGVNSRYCSYERAQKELGWFPKTSIEKGMRQVYEAACSA
jgi:UDP-glucose 4-epimerase